MQSRSFRVTTFGLLHTRAMIQGRAPRDLTFDPRNAQAVKRRRLFGMLRSDPWRARYVMQSLLLGAIIFML